MKWKNLNYRDFLLTLILAVIVGILACVGALIFRALTAFVCNLLFSGHLSFIFHETHHIPPSIWGIGIMFVPIIGGLFVIWIIENFAQDERGLSVPKIMYKIRHHEGKIHPKIALAKTIASAISIGSGASIGREGPVVEIGAALGSLIGDIITLSGEQRKILTCAGAAAATTVIFNTPLAGMAFAMELLLASVNSMSVICIAIAVIIATLFESSFIGASPIFVVHVVVHFKGIFTIIILLLCILFGIVLGVISVLFIRLVYWFEDLFNFIFNNPYLRHGVGMFFVGIMLYALIRQCGHYYIEGIGFATIQDCLNLLIMNPWLLLLLFVCKFLATCLSLGSGASGGIFSPALFLGATIGTFFGLLLNHFFPDIGVSPVLFTIIGMAGVLGSVTGAIVTAILLSLEVTGDWYSFLPMILTTIIAYAVRKQIIRESIYTLNLVRRGIN